MKRNSVGVTAAALALFLGGGMPAVHASQVWDDPVPRPHTEALAPPLDRRPEPLAGHSYAFTDSMPLSRPVAGVAATALEPADFIADTPGALATPLAVLLFVSVLSVFGAWTRHLVQREVSGRAD